MIEPIATMRRIPQAAFDVSAIVFALAAASISVSNVVAGLRPPMRVTACPLLPPSIRKLPRITIAESHSIDSIQIGSSVITFTNQTKPFEIRRGTALTIRGWAIDRGAEHASNDVFTNVGGVPISAHTGLPRGDVATALGNIAYANSGFALSIPTTRLPLGTIDLTIEGVDSAKSGFYDLGRPISFVVTQ